MAKAAKTRKQLLKEPDQFITFSARLIDFGRSHLKSILIATGIVAAVLLILITVRQVSIRNENRASEQIEKVMAKYDDALHETDAKGAYDRTKGDFVSVFDQYPSKKAVRLARIVYGDMSLDAGDVDTAISMYAQALKDFDQTPSIKNIVLSGLGYAHLQKKEYPQAMEYFESVANGNDGSMKSGALFNLAWLYEAAGDKEKSHATYEKLLAEFPDTTYGELVKKKLNR